MESLTSLLKAVGPAAVNQEVRSKILELIQSWATATEGRYDLSYIGEVYKATYLVVNTTPRCPSSRKRIK